MHQTKTIPEFLCYRYKGVKRVDQILATAVPFAWKCRKYQNWKDVQNGSDDKQLLLRFADALLNGPKVILSDYGCISRINYNVQRWRKDKEFADEADPLPSWVELDTLLQVVAENPKVVVQKLEKEIPGLKNISPHNLWDIFYEWALLQMLKAQKVPGIPDLDFKLMADHKRLEGQIAQLVCFFYESVGLPIPSPTKNIREMITALCKDLDFPVPSFDYGFTSEDLAQSASARTLVICYAALSPLQVIKIAEAEGHIHLTINNNHAFVKGTITDERSKAALEAFVSAYAEAVQRFPVHKETFEALTACIGVNLQRRSN